MSLTLRAAALAIWTLSAATVWAQPEPVHEGVPLTQWIAEFKSQVPARRSKAVRAFVALGPQAAPAVPTLLADLQTKSSEAIYPLAKIGAAAVPGLMPLLDVDDAAVKQKAAGALSGMDSQAATQIAAALESAPAARRKRLFDVLERMGPKAEPAAPALERWLQHDEAEVRLLAARGLAHITPRSNPRTMPVIKAAIQSRQLSAAADGAYALWKALELAALQYTWQTCDDQGLAELRGLLHADQSGQRLTALRAAKVMVGHGRLIRSGAGWPKPAADAAGQQALYERITRELYPGVVENLSHGDEQVRVGAWEALSTFGAMAAAQTPRLIEMLAGDPDSIPLALTAIKGIGPAAVAAAPRVKELTGHADPLIRQKAQEALASLTPANNEPPAGKVEPKLLGRDRHAGYTGFQAKDNIYDLSAGQAMSIRETRLRFQARGDRGPNTAGKISVSLDRQTWHEVGQWSKSACEKAAQRDNWHTLDLTAAPALNARRIYVRFLYTGGSEQLNVSEVVWERQ